MFAEPGVWLEPPDGYEPNPIILVRHDSGLDEVAAGPNQTDEIHGW